MVFGDTRKKSLPYKKVSLRPILLKHKLSYQAEYHYEKKAVHENLETSEVLDFCLELIIRDFKQINIFTTEKDIQILASKPNNPKIIKKSASKSASNLKHNQTKQYIIADQQPCDFLIRLGVMGQDGKVFQKHYSKFRQINRYLEIVGDVLVYLPQNRTLKIIDFGCGKAYLTFALYHYLRVMLTQDVEIIGLDLKEDVIKFCNTVAKDLHYDGLTFEMGDIADYSSDSADMVVTLHACDTATDFALMNAVRWKSQVILAVPCCQHELFNQIDNPLHQPMYKHGILKDRFTELLTDGLRGLKLESMGYEVSMIEFTSLEHTSKNILLKAVFTSDLQSDEKAADHKKRAAQEYAALKEFYNVNPTIDRL